MSHDSWRPQGLPYILERGGEVCYAKARNANESATRAKSTNRARKERKWGKSTKRKGKGKTWESTNSNTTTRDVGKSKTSGRIEERIKKKELKELKEKELKELKERKEKKRRKKWRKRTKRERREWVSPHTLDMYGWDEILKGGLK